MIPAGNLPSQPNCAVEGCRNPGVVRVFPHYRLTLCHGDWIRALVAHYARAAS